MQNPPPFWLLVDNNFDAEFAICYLWELMFILAFHLLFESISSWNSKRIS